MKILLTGAGGFLGTHLREALIAQGHELICAGRAGGTRDARCRWVEADFATALPPRWSQWLQDVDAVVNLVGIFREHGSSSFERLHVLGPTVLFDACVAAGVQRVLQVSALGARPDADTAYLRSKAVADAHLLALPLEATVLQPSLIFGADGSSSQRFLALATLPLLPLPAGGRQVVQPVHVGDAVAALCALLAAPPGRWRGRRIAIVGPRPLLLRDYLLALRAQLGLRATRVIAVPRPLVALAAWWGERSRRALFDRAAWRMLEHGSQADPAELTRLLGAAPRPVQKFVAPAQAEALRRAAAWQWLAPLLRGALALVWIWTGIVSLGLYPVEASHALLSQAGVPPWLQPLALVGAAGLDLLLGVLTLAPLAPYSRRVLWFAQALLILGYTAIITLRLPEYWLHPYGPLSKNLPMLALLALLAAFEPRH